MKHCLHKPNIFFYISRISQVLATSALNLIILTFGITLQISTIIIPSIDESKHRDSDETVQMTHAQTSWLG